MASKFSPEEDFFDDDYADAMDAESRGPWNPDDEDMVDFWAAGYNNEVAGVLDGALLVGFQVLTNGLMAILDLAAMDDKELQKTMANIENVTDILNAILDAIEEPSRKNHRKMNRGRMNGADQKIKTSFQKVKRELTEGNQLAKDLKALNKGTRGAVKEFLGRTVRSWEGVLRAPERPKSRFRQRFEEERKEWGNRARREGKLPSIGDRTFLEQAEKAGFRRFVKREIVKQFLPGPQIPRLGRRR